MFLEAGSAGELGQRRGLEQVGFWRKILAHPGYDAFWRDQAVDQVLAAQPLQSPGDARAQPVGPGGHLRRHGGLQGHQAEGHEQRQGLPGDGARGITAQEIRDGSSLGALKFPATPRSTSAARSCVRSWTNT